MIKAPWQNRKLKILTGIRLKFSLRNFYQAILSQRQAISFRARAENLRDSLAKVNALPQMALLGLITGLVSGLLIIIFRLLIDIPLRLLPESSPENFEQLGGKAHFWLPFLGAIALGVIFHFIAKQNQSTGVPHVIDRLQNHQGKLPAANLWVQFWGGIACLVTGQSVGREGPAVHLGAGTGSLLGQWLKLPGNNLRPLAACGVAAAIAACFNTPMAGVIFAMEVVMMDYTVASAIPIILAAVAGTALSHLVFGDIVNFGLTPQDNISLVELPLLFIAGALIACLAAAYIRMQSFWCKISLRYSALPRFALAGLITGCVASFYPEIMGIGYDTIQLTIQQHPALWVLLGITCAKLLVSSAVLGLGLPGGVIGPLLFIGATAGGMVGVMANLLLPNLSSPLGLYVVLGMGAMMGATLNAPLAALIAVIELTYNPAIIFPGMIVVVIATLSARTLFRTPGLFESVLHIQGKLRTPHTTERLLSSSAARQIIERRFVTCSVRLNNASASDLLSNNPKWLLVAEEKLLIAAQDLAAFLASNEKTTDSEFELLDIPGTKLDLIEIASDATLFEAYQQMNHHQVNAGFLRSTNGEVLGIITHQQINDFYKI